MQIHIKNKNTPWFTLIETLVGTLIFSVVVIAGFSALNSILVWNVKLIEKTNIQKEAFYFSEKLFEMIKTWGLIDYEEYWNRYSYDTTYGSGHFINPTGFGNDNSSPYYCLSWNALSMWTAWCLTGFNTNPASSTLNSDYSWTPQRYGQYEVQFIDYNSDSDNDVWDEDNSAEAEYSDPDAPTWATCTWTNTMTGSGCLWTIEFLKLTGVDYGYDHLNTGGAFDNDGLIDTWLIHDDFESSAGDVVATAGSPNYWQALFPDTIHVRDVQFFPYPNKDLEYSWRDGSSDINISPYVRISMTLTPSWKSRKKIRGEVPEIEINTTVQLTDIFN